jgi:hypothetical protein
MGKYTVEAVCSSCGGQRTVDKYHVKSPYVCRPCSARRTGLRTWAANTPFKIQHGGKDSRLYRIWCAMKQRCLNQRNPSYKNYGGRGIFISDQWRTNFGAFQDWALANGYADGLEIDRINNNGPYASDNCRWTTKKQNTRNRRVVRLSEVEAEAIKYQVANGMAQKHVAALFNVSPQTVNYIVKGKQWA